MSTTSQVIVNVDTKLKKLAMKKAKSLGMPFSAVLNMAIRGFVEDRLKVDLTSGLNIRTQLHMNAAEKDLKKGKNISPRFKNIDEMRAWVDNTR